MNPYYPTKTKDGAVVRDKFSYGRVVEVCKSYDEAVVVADMMNDEEQEFLDDVDENSPEFSAYLEQTSYREEGVFPSTYGEQE